MRTTMEKENNRVPQITIEEALAERLERETKSRQGFGFRGRRRCRGYNGLDKCPLGPLTKLFLAR